MLFYVLIAPELSPTNFDVLKDTMNATSATFTWDGVDEDDKRLRGFFTGYLVSNN